MADLDQLLAQNALIADALYDLVKLVARGDQIAGSSVPEAATLLQDAKTKVNALNPAKFTFP